MREPVRQVDVQPARDAARERGKDDLVEVPAFERFLVRVHRVMAERDRTGRSASRSLLNQRQRKRKYMFALEMLLLALRLRQLSVLSWIRDKQMETCVTTGGPRPNRLQQRRCRSGLVRDDKDLGRG